MTDLKPCPFCGDKATHWMELDCDQCTRCGALGPEYGVNVNWNTRVSPWRSLKDYRAPEDIDATILLRRTERLAWMLCGPLGRKRMIEFAMADGFDEYMEVPS